MSDRQTPNTCSVRIAGSATRGANEYRDDQHAGVDNSVQAAQGGRVAAGAFLRRADPSPLGTADSLSNIVEKLWQRRNEAVCKTGKQPADFALTPDEYCELRNQVQAGSTWFGFSGGGEFPCKVFGIPVRIVSAADGR